jgi:serine-type D-Ala-D-Ala carboxypeptidase (penicillin-binding protein 5/6)
MIVTQEMIRMKKGLITGLSLCLMMWNLGGCQTRTQEFLTYREIAASSGYAMDNQLTKTEFFAEDLVVITEEENNGEDESLTSGSSLLVSVTDQKLIYADDIYDRLYPASLTKLMTALVVLQYGELTDSVIVSYAASHITEGGAKLCGFKEGDVISMDALLKSLLVYSGNDAAIAIADHMAGSEEAFVRLMNDEADKIGAVHTNFVNSHGLHDDNQYTTAYDMYLIFNELLKYDTFRSVIGTASYTAVYVDKDGISKEKEFKATNAYLKEEADEPEGIQVLGGKTGTTRKAGNCLILLSKDTSNKEYISVIMKASDSASLYSQMSYLLSLTKAD